MKIGIFGDSYAATSYDKHYENTPWTILLKESIGTDKMDVHARGGTSHWFSYTKFMKHISDYDCVIFCHTNSTRWPVMPLGLERMAWNIGYVPDAELDKYNSIRKDIMSDELLYYISSNIFKDINRICQENNIYLINIMSFPLDFELPNTNFPILINLDQVSRREKIKYEGKYKPTIEVNGNLGYDLRECHLNSLNNKKLANITHDLLQNKTKDICVDLINYDWAIDDPILDKIYEKNSNNR